MHDDQNKGWKQAHWLKVLSHVGGYLSDYMMTEYRSRAGVGSKAYSVINNLTYKTMWDESKQFTQANTNSLFHGMLTSWGQYQEESWRGHERIGDIFEIAVAHCFYANDWKPLYQVVEYACLHEIKDIYHQKPKTKGKSDAELLKRLWTE